MEKMEIVLKYKKELNLKINKEDIEKYKSFVIKASNLPDINSLESANEAVFLKENQEVISKKIQEAFGIYKAKKKEEYDEVLFKEKQLNDFLKKMNFAKQKIIEFGNKNLVFDPNFKIPGITKTTTKSYEITNLEKLILYLNEIEDVEKYIDFKKIKKDYPAIDFVEEIQKTVFK